MCRRVAVFPVGAKIVPHLERVFAGDFGERRLYCIDVGRSDIPAAVTKWSEGTIGASTADRKLWQVTGVPEERRVLGRGTKALGIGRAFVVTAMRLEGARETRAAV